MLPTDAAQPQRCAPWRRVFCTALPSRVSWTHQGPAVAVTTAENNFNNT